MSDVHTPEQRRRNMQAVRNKNTAPEVMLRKLLFARGLRFRLHVAGMHGKPDFVLPKHRVAVFVHGCFWHGHDCYLFKLPKARREFWAAKIDLNRQRDRVNVERLSEDGWRVLLVWECALRGRLRWAPDLLADAVSTWVRTGSAQSGPTEIRHVAAPPSNQ